MRAQIALTLLVLATVGAPPAAVAGDDVDHERRSFFADRRAYREGDVLTVLITEFSTVSTSARTRTSKAESANASILQPDGAARGVAAAFDSKFAGGGEIERSGKLLAKLAVTIEGIDSLGNLSVHGEQDIQVNNERQRIRLDGFVRAEDIEADNTIASWRVGGARIEFTGKGLLARKQSPGILTRLLSWIWE
jgi:flagellar L-ring protein precursor FlgH